MDPLKENGSVKLGDKNFNVRKMSSVMHANGIFTKGKEDWYRGVNRFGWIDYKWSVVNFAREYLFFTKPDLYIMDGSTVNNAKLSASLYDNPFFMDAFQNHKNVLNQLQYSVADAGGMKCPFMFILTNAVTSKMDIPGISAESQESTSNLYGTSINYRTHSLKSDNGYDFTLSFQDTKSLEVYMLAKAYDEYMRLRKTGQIDILNNNTESNADIYKNYVVSKVVPEQFSVYKFVILDDGETIAYYAKATGVFISDVPRSEFTDPANDGIKFSLSFHANFVEDNNPMILYEFNKITNASQDINIPYADIWDDGYVNNEFVQFPCIRAYADSRAQARGVYKDYRLKWTNIPKAGVYIPGYNIDNLAGPYSTPGNNSGILEHLGATATAPILPVKKTTFVQNVTDTIRTAVTSGIPSVANSIGSLISTAVSTAQDYFSNYSLRVAPDGETVTVEPILDLNKADAKELMSKYGTNII